MGARKARELLQQADVDLVLIPNVPSAHCKGLTLRDAGRAVVGITDASDIERRADAFADEVLIPANERWWLQGIHSMEDLERVSREGGVKPGIFIGQLRYHGLRPHTWGAKFLRKVVNESPERLCLP